MKPGPSMFWRSHLTGLSARATAACGLLVLLQPAAPCAAQHALVLSGGGARGLAHAGAIVALEEIGYRPTLVIGTSMGAIIGALYAAGYSAEQIREITARENWLEMMATAPILVGPRRDLRRPLLGFGINRARFFGGALSAPGIDQRLIELLFDAGVRARNDFDRLPVRYRAVAADLSTGEEVVLRDFDLPRAVRASMAVPGAFVPVRWRDRVLVDGGIANNLAVSVARSLTNARIIAIDVLRPRTEIEERAALEVAVRSLRLMIENARPDVGSMPDILVLPHLEPGLSETYFPSDAAGLLRSGHAAVLEQVSPVTREPESRRSPGPAPERIAALRIGDADSAEARLIRRIMRASIGEYDAARVIEGTSALYQTGLFQAVWPRLEYEGDRDPVLVVDVTPVASTSVSGAARWDNDVGASAWLSLRQGVLLNTPVELRLDGTIDQLGQAGSIDASFFSALVPGLVWNGGGHAFEQRIRIIEDTIAALPRVRRAGGWIGGELRGPVRDWSFSLLMRAEHLRAPGSPEGWTYGPFVRIARAPAPDRVVGVDPLFDADLRGGDVEYQRARLRLSLTQELGQASAALVVALAASSADAPVDALPGLDLDIAPWLPAGVSPNRLFAALGADAALPILLNGHGRVRFRAIATGAGSSDFANIDAWRPGGEMGAIWPTVLGPISMGVAIGQDADWRFNIAVGSAF